MTNISRPRLSKHTGQPAVSFHPNQTCRCVSVSGLPRHKIKHCDYLICGRLQQVHMGIYPDHGLTLAPLPCYRLDARQCQCQRSLTCSNSCLKKRTRNGECFSGDLALPEARLGLEKKPGNIAILVRASMTDCCLDASPCCLWSLQSSPSTDLPVFNGTLEENGQQQRLQHLWRPKCK